MDSENKIELTGIPCPCPGTPHAVEWVELEPEVTIPMGMAAMYLVKNFEDGTSEAQARGELAPVMMRFGIRSWSFRGLNGASIPINATTIARLLPFSGAGFEVADACERLYMGGLIRPLVARQSRQLEPGPTADTTSRIPSSGPRPRKLHSRSSRKTTAGKPSEAPAQ